MTAVDLVVDSFRRTPQGAGHSERTRQELLAALAEANLLDGLGELQIREFDEDEVLLVGPDGDEVQTWQQDYPYQQRMSREEYVGVIRGLQIELLKMQSWVKDTGQRVVVLFEGRDAAGKGGTIQRFIEHLNPRGARVVALEKPTTTEATQWYFQRYFSRLPSAGEIVLFDRSWYNRAVVEPVMGLCTPAEHREFLQQASGLEKALVDSGIHLVKLWFSVSRAEQRTRFTIRVIDPLRQWKLSPVDLAALNRWDDYTRARRSSAGPTPRGRRGRWCVVMTRDAAASPRSAGCCPLWTIPAGPGGRGDADPLIVGPPDQVYEQSERSWSRRRNGLPINPTAGRPELCLDKR